MRTYTRAAVSAFETLSSNFDQICIVSEQELLRSFNELINLKTSDKATKLNTYIQVLNKLGKLNENEIKEFVIKFEEPYDEEYFERIIKKIGKKDETNEKNLDKAFFTNFKEQFLQYPTPRRYMERLVKDLCVDNKWKNDSVRLQILKHFILAEFGSYGGKKTIIEYVKKKLGRKIKKNENMIEVVLEHIDDQVFDFLNQSFDSIENDDLRSKEKKSFSESLKPDGKYGLLKVCNNLANGNFIGKGSTIKSMYLFAMVFNMTFEVKQTLLDTETVGINDVNDYRSDVEIQLFKKYFTTNLVHIASLMKEHGDELAGKDYFVASEYGINYKNIEELIYLYFISQSDMKASDKIKNSVKMLNDVKESTKNLIQDEECCNNNLNTVDWIEKIILDDIFIMNANEFSNFLVEFYSSNRKECSLEISQGFSHRRAFEEYNSINEILYKVGRIYTHSEPELISEFGYGLVPFKELWFIEKEKQQPQQIHDSYLNNDDDDDSLLFAEAVNVTHRILKNKRFIKVETAEKMSRLAMISLFYYMYNDHFEGDMRLINKRIYSDPDLYMFSYYFDKFKYEIDQYLGAAGYAPLSVTNLFDILVVYSSFMYVQLLREENECRNV